MLPRRVLAPDRCRFDCRADQFLIVALHPKEACGDPVGRRGRLLAADGT
jgi:hypothetical protein